MKTLEERSASEIKADQSEAETGQLLRQYEADKLIQEMRTLIEKKGLSVDLVSRPGAAAIRDLRPMAGCSSCTICPCMICW
jgi:hypothetical protein